MKRYLARSACLAAVGVLLTAVAGCGGSDSDGGDASGGASGHAKERATLNIGVVGSFGGAAGVSPGTPKAMEAWAESVNAAGGLNGSDVRVIVKDVATTTGAGRAEVQKLIDDDEVVAIVDQDPSDTTWVQYAETRSVPVIVALEGFGSLLSPNAYPVVSTPVTNTYSTVASAKTLGDSLAYGYPSEIAALAQFAELMQTFGDELGVSMPIVTKMSSSQPDYTAFCQQVRSKGVSSFFLGFAPPVVEKIADQCHQQGVDVPQILRGYAAQPSWRSNAAFDGGLVVDPVAPFFDASLPAVKRYRDALEEYAPEIVGTHEDTSNPLTAWAGGEMIAAAASKARGPLTSASLVEGLRTMDRETLDGLIVPVTYTGDRPSAAPCWFTWRVTDGEFVTLGDAKPRCAPEETIAPVEADVAESLGG